MKAFRMEIYPFFAFLSPEIIFISNFNTTAESYFSSNRFPFLSTPHNTTAKNQDDEHVPEKERKRRKKAAQ